MSKTPWWKGTHGEWFVVAQVALILMVFFGRAICRHGQSGQHPLPGWARLGAVLSY